MTFIGGSHVINSLLHFAVESRDILLLKAEHILKKKYVKMLLGEKTCHFE